VGDDVARLPAEALGDAGLNGRTVLLTGASKGIGAATARALGESGAHVVAHYGSDEAGARDATAAIPEERKLLVQADFADPGAAARLWDEAVAWRGRIDVLVNNAAVMPATPLDANDADWGRGWEQALQVNVRAPADLIRAAVPHFVAAGGGVLIPVSSWVAQRGPRDPALIAYAASKAAVKALTQAVARHHAKDGVLAHVIAPGVVGTELSLVAAERTGGTEALLAGLAMGEWVPPQELAALIVFLASGRVRNLTGATFDVNGASYIR
jgi:NAD(P)-dependent dehydrogenase (short-subunit alcohol dehydrogenase family)